MTVQIRPVHRDMPMLLPPDLRDWMPEDDLVHFVIQAVEQMPLTPNTFAINHRGTGSKQYSPRMMLALLVYCYANGIFSSRRIERATFRDVAVRYLTGDTHPDHDTICTFRRRNQQAFIEAFLYDFRPPRDKKPRTVTDPRLVAMQTKMQSAEARQRYGKRKQTVEPVFGIIKSVMGFRSFRLRGMSRVSLEWTLTTLAYNVKRLHALSSRASC